MRVPGTALQLGLCHICWQDPREAEQTPPAAGTGICPLCGTSHAGDVPDSGTGHCADTATSKEVLKGPAEEVTAVDKHTDMLHVNRNCSWPSTSENVGMLQ